MSEKKKSATPSRDNKSVISDNKSTPGTAKSKGKSKKSKVREEEERKRMEEEAQLRLQEEERERKAQQKREQEESKKRAIKIVELKNRELREFYDLVNQLRERIAQHHKSERAQAEWIRYIKCDGSPNPTLATEINTFLTLWKEDEENKDAQSLFKNTDLSLKLIQELKNVIGAISSEDNSSTKIGDYEKTICELENVMWKKIQQTSHFILSNASYNIDPETLNYDFSIENPNLKFCIWANLSHNPRIREFVFSKQNYSFGLPRPLTLANITIVSLFMNFDLFSPLSLTYNCRVKNENYEFDPIPELKQLEGKGETDEEAKREATEDDLLPPELRALMEKTDLTKDDEVDKIKEEETSMAVLEREKTKIEPEKKQLDKEELAVLQELADTYVIDLRNFLPVGPLLHLGLFKIPPQPKKVKSWTIIQKDFSDTLQAFDYPSQEPSLVELSWQDYCKKRDNVDGADENTNRTKVDMNSTLRSDVLDSTMGADDTLNSDKLNKTLGTKQTDLNKLMKAEGPINITYKLPITKFYYGNEIVLARWDSHRKHWRTDEILDFNYENGEISFKTYHFSPYCLMQDRHFHMPIQSWTLVPRESMNSSLLYVETANFEMHIEIELDRVRILVPLNKQKLEEDTKQQQQKVNSKTPQPVAKDAKKSEVIKEEVLSESDRIRLILEPLANKWMKLDDLISSLKFLGLNIFPEPDSEKFVSIANKNKKLEWLVYQNMTLCSNLMAFEYSRFNSEINDENKIVVSAMIHNSKAKINKDNYKNLICTLDVFKISEASDEFNETCAPGTDEHADLYHLCCELCNNNESLINRMAQMDSLYFDTCSRLLNSIKLITFS